MERPLARAVEGAVSGVIATGVMSLFMGGAKWLGGLGEPPPRIITRRLLSRVLGPLRPRGEALDATALATHVAFGASLGVIYGLLPERARSPAGSLLFGAAVWTANYAGWLPGIGLMPEPSRDRPGRPTTMLAAHLVFGAALAGAYPRVAEVAHAASAREHT